MRNENDNYHSPINQSPMLSIKLSGLLCSYIYLKKTLRPSIGRVIHTHSGQDRGLR